MHTIPLTMLIIYNNNMLEKSETVDMAAIYLGVVNVMFNICEVSYYRYWQNKGINLEQRVKMATNKRVCDLLRLSFLAILFGFAFVLAGLYAFEKQGCLPGFYEKDGIECLRCTEFLSDECLLCSSSKQCTKSVDGTYIVEFGEDTGFVDKCSNAFEGCLSCDAAVCNKCDEGFYLSLGRCLPCDSIEGCVEG